MFLKSFAMPATTIISGGFLFFTTDWFVRLAYPGVATGTGESASPDLDEHDTTSEGV